MSQPDALARIDSIAALLVERSQPAIIRLATTGAEIEAAQRLRGEALLERGWASDADLVDGREVDADDGRATHILALLDDLPIGTCRLIFPAPGRPVPMEQRDGATHLPVQAVEVGRVVVAGPTGGVERSLTAALIGKAWLEIRVRGYRRICGTVSAGVLRLYRRLGFLVQVIGPSVTIFGQERFPILFEPTDEAAEMSSKRMQ